MSEKKTKVIAVINQKGGVGKTTTTANLGYALAKAGREVLLIDWDSQSSLTGYFNVGLSDSDYLSIYEVAIKELRGIDPEYDEHLGTISLREMIAETICRPTYTGGKIKMVNGERKYVSEEIEFGIDLLPTKLELSDYELELGENKSSGMAFHLTNIIEEIKQIKDYDYILIDCNPSLGFLAMNAMIAATDGILIPTNLDVMSIRGVKNLIDRIAETQNLLLERRRMNHMGVIGIVLNLYADRRSVDKTIQDDMYRFYPFKIFNTTIPESVNAKKAVLTGVTYSQMYKKAEIAYQNLAKELEERLSEMEKQGPVIARVLGSDFAGIEYTDDGKESEE